MEKQLNYIRLLSLKEMAFRRIAVALCNEPGILNYMAEYQFNYEQFKREDRFPNVSQILSKLLLPESLKMQLTPMIKSVGDEILRWKLFHKKYLNGDICVRVLEKLCWTTAGTVNYRETAGKLMHCNVLRLKKRFLLACFYCYENYIPMFWKQLSDEDKRTIYLGNISRITNPRLQLFLPNILERVEYEFCLYNPSPYFCGGPLNKSFELAAMLGNKTVAEYCWGNLTKAERESSLVRVARRVIRYRKDIVFKMNAISFIIGRLLSEVSCYLLSLMTAEEEIEILRELPCEILTCCLDWPYQDLFRDAANVIWAFLPESKYEYLLNIMHVFISPGYYFSNALQEFFLRSPVHFRKCFVDYECRNLCFFRSFLLKKDAETIRIFLRNLEAADRARLLFTEESLHLFYCGVDDWSGLEVFLREAILTKEQKQRLKVSFMEYARRRGGMEYVELCVNRRFFEILDECDACAQRKRSSKDETLTCVKKLCKGRKENVIY